VTIRNSGTVRIACVQYEQRRIASFEAFAARVEFFVRAAADYRADFVVFPEIFTLQLLSATATLLPPAQAVTVLAQDTERFRSLLASLAEHYRINIVGGSHLARTNAGVRNVCHVALRDGSLHAREKIHVTPSERDYWGVGGGDSADIIETDCGPIGVTICYDSEFPELTRHLVDQGALLLFVPFCTDTREGYLRVRYACHARAIENQCYLALAGNVGNIDGVGNFDIQYARSCVLTPCDFPFARDGIAAEAPINTEQLVFADVSLTALTAARTNGTVRNLADRRHDLYHVDWRKPD
jgi:predicted amidohydrolase